MENVLGYAGHYKVSEQGDILSLKKGKAKLLRPLRSSNKYLTVILTKDGVQVSHLIHRLVATAFIPNPDNLPQVNHIDEDKTNNCVDNLEWCTAQRNIEHSRAKHYSFTSPEGEVHNIFNRKKFCREHSLDSSAMCRLSQGKLKQHKGWLAA